MNRGGTIALLALLTMGCAAAAPGASACLGAPVIEAPETGCISIGIESAGEDTCTMAGTTRIGSWIRLVHAADRAAHLEIFSLSSPTECRSDGTGCSFVYLSAGGPEPCSCTVLGGALQIGNDPLLTPTPFPLVAPVTDVLLTPVGASFHVSICADEADAFPTCTDAFCQATPTVRSGELCACTPECATDADCPQPRTGSIRAVCTSHGCVLPCGEEDACPDGQTCGSGGELFGSICMTPS